MAAPEPVDLVELGTAIADGTPVDWTATDLRSADPALGELLRHLQLIERIAAVHGSTAGASVTGEYDSIRSARPSAAAVVDAPITWGPLTLVEKIGRGAFGDVYRARDPKLDRPVALKLMRRRERGSDAFESEVIEEGRLLARIDHANVVTVYGAERIDGRVGLWMAFVEGRTLAEELKARGPLPPREVIEIGVALASALEAVHDAGLLHRDIKAQNVMRDATGRVLLTDFGAGRELVTADETTADGLAGTPLYLAPEVLDGAPASKASDVYSLGVLLYHLATGAFPVPGRTVRDLRDAHARGIRTAARQAKPGTPKRLAAVIDRATDPDRARRYQSAAELREALIDAARSPWTTVHAWGVTALVTMAAVAAVVYWRPGAATTGTPSFAEPGALTSVPVWSAWETVHLGKPSPDGGWLTCTIRSGREAGRLARCDLQTGAVELLGGGDLRARQPPTISPDGRLLAYARRAPSGRGSLNVVAPDGTGDRVLVAESPGETFVVHGWTNDNSEVVAVAASLETGGRRRLLAASLATGEVRELLPAGSPVGRLSPDGRYMVFPARTPAGRVNLELRDLTTGTEMVLADDVWDYNPRPVWTPSGAVLFTSDRNGTLGLWRVDVRDGLAAGPPVLVEDTGRREVWPYGFTSDGTFVHGLEPVGFDGYVAAVDPADGVVTSPRRIAEHPLDANATPAWSPDGEWLAYVSARPGNPDSDELDRAGLVTIRRTDGGDEQRFPVRQQYHQTRLRWWPDGGSVLLKTDRGLERRDRETGAVVETLLEGRTVQAFEMDVRRGRIFYMVRSSPNPEIRAYDPATGTDELVYTGPIPLDSGFSLSPDGRTLAVVARTRAGIEIRTVDTETHAEARGLSRGRPARREAHRRALHAGRAVPLLQPHARPGDESKPGVRPRPGHSRGAIPGHRHAADLADAASPGRPPTGVRRRAARPGTLRDARRSRQVVHTFPDLPHCAVFAVSAFYQMTGCRARLGRNTSLARRR